jgi:transcriptional regulator with XRE-family HTH domain
MSFGENLFYLRKKSKITQEELAEELDVSRQSVSKWETGEAYPDTEKLIALCDKFGVTMDDFMRGDLSKGDEKPQTVTDESVAKMQFNGEADDGVQIKSNETTGCGDEKTSKQSKVYASVSSVVMLCALCVFLVCGFVWNLWYVAWVAFLFSSAICLLLKIFLGGESDKAHTHKNGVEHNFGTSGRKKLHSISGEISGAVMLICTGVYLLVGMLCSIWHPTWIIFIVGATICTILGIF